MTSTSRQLQPLPPSSSSSQHASEPWHMRHVLLPWDLRDQSVEINDDIHGTLRNIFPGTALVYIGHERAFVIFRVNILPSAPWPKTVGGLPAVILPAQRRDLRCLFYPPSPNGVGGSKDNRLGENDPCFDKTNLTLATVRVIYNVCQHSHSTSPTGHSLSVVLTCEPLLSHRVLRPGVILASKADPDRR